MSGPSHNHHGSCHCGAVKIAFSTRFAVEELRVGRCDCSFCRRHGARTCSDPNGHLLLTETKDDAMSRYRFGLKTADFALCRTCGVYIAAMIDADGEVRATLNVNLLDARDRFDPAPPLVSYAAETADERRARRLARWTPSEIRSAIR